MKTDKEKRTRKLCLVNFSFMFLDEYSMHNILK